MSFSLSVALRLGQLDLEIELAGDASPVALVGPNGTGKSTVLRIIAGGIRPDRGWIRVGERTLFDAARGIDVPPEQRRVAYVPQGLGLFPHLRVVDNVAFGRLTGASRLSSASRRALAVSVLDRMGCGGLAERWPRALSGGEAQRVALARALMVDPDILLFDEPLSALDPGSRRSLRRLLAERLRELGRPCLVVTHDLRDARALGARVAVIEGGRIVQVGAIEDLVARPATDFVAELVDAAPARSDEPHGQDGPDGSDGPEGRDRSDGSDSKVSLLGGS